MWLSKQLKPVTATSDADLGITTISGKQVGVVTRGEVRDLPVYGPGGYLWTPSNGAAVLVVKGGPAARSSAWPEPSPRETRDRWLRERSISTAPVGILCICARTAAWTSGEAKYPSPAV